MFNNFFIVDVFAERRYSGNPLAVVLDDGVRDPETMQQIAAEINFSETTFVAPRPDSDGSYNVRIFTPVRELDFAGHPILGTAWLLREYIAKNATDQLSLKLRIGQVPVNFDVAEQGHTLAWFQAPFMSLGAEPERELLADALGIGVDDIETKAPARMVSAGTAAVVVPLRGLEALERCDLNLDRYQTLLEQGFPPLVYLFTRETRDPNNDLCVRFFFEAHGVREDPATGNGAAFLGAYLLEHEFLSKRDFSLRIEQGHMLQRPSLILLRACVNGGVQQVHVGGRVVPVAQGELL